MSAAAPDRPLLRTWSGVVLISFSGLLVRLAAVEASRSAFLRNAYALPVLVLLAVWARRRGARGLAGLVVPMAMLAGGLLGADLVAWHVSIGLIGAGLATVLPNLQVIVVGVAGILVFGEKPHRRFWLALPVVGAGVWLLAATGQPVEPGGDVVLGVALGLLTALFYSGYLLLLRLARMRRPDAGAFDVMASATFGATLVTGAVAALEGVAAPAGRWPAEGWLIALALGSQVIGWVLLASSIHRIPAALTSVALLLQPVLAMIWGAWILDEPIGWLQVAGATLILVGVGVAHRAVVRGAREARVAAERPGG